MPQPNEHQHDHQNPRVRKPASSIPIKTRTIDTAADPIKGTGANQKKSFSERCRTSRFWLVRALYAVIRSVWMVVMVVGGFIVWLIAMLFI